MKGENIRIFVDFDGTVTQKDVGNGIFDRFLRPDLLKQGWHEEIIRDWKAGRITSRECLSLECEYSVVTEKELNEELDTYAITPGFIALSQYCRKHEIPLVILSDGLDYYIEYILEKNGLSDIEYRANHMYFSNGSLGVEFPFSEKGCGKCGNCKRWHIDTLNHNGDSVIYVGDGYSDRYAIRSADVIFARSDLTEFCIKENLKYIPYDDFYDVLNFIENGDGNL